MARRIELSEIERMLKKCAPGYEARVSDHKRRYKYNGRYAHLPTKEKEVYAQIVQKLARELQLDAECVKKHLDISIDIPKPTE